MARWSTHETRRAGDFEQPETTAVHLCEVVTRCERAGDTPGAVWWVRRGGTALTGSAGTHGPGHLEPVRPDTVFRISSLTRPVVAPAAMTLVDDGTLRLDDPVDPGSARPDRPPRACRPVGLPTPGDGLVSTVEARAACAAMLRAGGVAPDGSRVRTVDAVRHRADRLG